MIASIRGQIAEKRDAGLVVEVGGVGVLVHVPAPLINEFRLGELISLHTHLVVREDSLSLYGFQLAEEREYFELLLGISGIGPRLALAVLSTLNPDTIRRAVFTEQSEIFSRVPGIGKKTAQRMLLYLQDRIKAVSGFAPVAALDDTDTQVLEALIALGYSVVEAQSALQSIPRDAPRDVEERIRLALRYFSS